MSLGNSVRQQRRRQLMAAVQPLPQVDTAGLTVVFAPHFDDETLGCGGLIAHKRQAGQPVRIVFMTDGRSSHPQVDAARLTAWRRQEAVVAAARLGVGADQLTFLDFPEGELRWHEREMTTMVTGLLRAWQPTEIYRPFHHDLLPDHVWTQRIVENGWELSGKTAVCYSYFVWFWHHWPWNGRSLPFRWAVRGFLANTLRYGLWRTPFTHLYDIRPQLSAKMHALQAYHSQMERLTPDWAILADVADGQFLACFQQPFEAYQQALLPLDL